MAALAAAPASTAAAAQVVAAVRAAVAVEEEAAVVADAEGVGAVADEATTPRDVADRTTGNLRASATGGAASPRTRARSSLPRRTPH